ncbi:MAG: LuxR C-terminal-related transcriptional regulator [Peptococcaceae bacterium]|nr:LuxR C-terminal-related transcriptional regulator [Peptococcaceae bacterium]
MRKKANQKRMYYFSEKLKRQLEQITRYPLTVVEAPSGFGKTTAVKEYLKENLSPEACEYWYTCLGEPASWAWRGICELLANANEEIAANLKKLEMPATDTLFYITGILRDFHCRKETYLVIDNYQLVDCDIPWELMSVFSGHGNPNLHIIFITQQLGPRQKLITHNGDIHIIDTSAFFFDREGTASLFRMEGIRLTPQELESVFTSTEGWVSAIRLQIINFEETGSFDCTAGIEQLVENAIWKRLTPEEREFLLSVSVMEGFNARQAAIMMGRETLPEEIEELLKSNDFIRYFPDKGLYTIHSILRDYLQNRFCHYQPEDFQKRILYLAGQAYAAESQIYAAAQLFFKVGEFEAILSMPFSGDYIDNQREKDIPDYIELVVNQCPQDILCKYPFVMLMFSYTMLLDGRMEVFQKLCRLIGRTVEGESTLSREERRRVKGEFALLMSFIGYNDIRKMTAGRKQALEILGGPSVIIVNSMPWTFGCTSILSMFWRESGSLEDTLRDMDECLPYYLKLTRGHGSGANIAMRAEAMLMRGEEDEAEILCHRALYEARSHQQAAIGLCSELVLARIAILRGDPKGYFSAIKNIQGYAKESSQLHVLRMADLCLAVVSLVLGTTDYVAKWLWDMESIKKTLYSPSIPYGQIFYSKLLLMEKRYSELYGISGQILDTAGSEYANIKYLMPRVCQLIHLAVAKHDTGKEIEAREHLKEALALTLPDKVYLPFAQQKGALGDLVKSLVNSFPDREGINAIAELCQRQEKGAGIIRKAVLQEKSPLTPREREIALLAKSRLSAKEIAGRLCISDATVRTMLRSIYGKLDIHSKNELDLKKF